MNQKDLNRVHIFIDPDAKNVYLSKIDGGGNPTGLQREVTPEFIQTMIHYLITKSNNGLKPVVISRSDIPTFEVTIQLTEEMRATGQKLIINPG